MINLLPYFIIIIAFWTYFFVYAFRNRIGYPWGFVIVPIGLSLLGREYVFIDDLTLVFSINLTLMLCLIGLFWNINNIKEQIFIEDRGKNFRYIGIGLILGLLFGLGLQIPPGVKEIQTRVQFTFFAVIAAGVQTSVAEEFLIRGYFLGYLKKYGFNQILSVVFQALFFTFLHVPQYSGDWTRLLIVFLVGVISGSLVSKSNNLIPSFVLHSTSNLIAIFWRLNIS